MRLWSWPRSPANTAASISRIQRSETDAIFDSLNEVFAISRRANISTTIWHLKTAYHENFGKMPEVLRRIQDARAQGIDVAASVYPYTRASNGLTSSFPPWVSEGGIGQMIARFKDRFNGSALRKKWISQALLGKTSGSVPVGTAPALCWSAC